MTEQNNKKDESIEYLKHLKTRDDATADAIYQLKFSRQGNKNIQENYDLLQEKYQKEKDMLEAMVTDLNKK